MANFSKCSAQRPGEEARHARDERPELTAEAGDGTGAQAEASGGGEGTTWKDKPVCMYVCVTVSVCVCVHASMRVCVCVHACM